MLTKNFSPENTSIKISGMISSVRKLSISPSINLLEYFLLHMQRQSANWGPCQNHTRIHDKLIPHFEEDYSHAISLTRWLERTQAATNAGQQKRRREITCPNSVGDWQTQDFSGQQDLYLFCEPENFLSTKVLRNQSPETELEKVHDDKSQNIQLKFSATQTFGRIICHLFKVSISL